MNILPLKMIPACLAVVLASLLSVASAADDAREIMMKVDDMTNHSYESSIRLIKFSTCRYRIKDDGALVCAERPRNLSFESVSKSYSVEGSRDDNNKTFDVIIDPISDKGTAMVSWGYADDEKDSDFWIYLPVLAKVKRIVAVSDGNESGAVFGSEYSTEDSDVRKIKDYTYQLLGEDVYKDRPTWKIEMTPTAYRRTRSYYGKIVTWVDKERHIVLKDDLYDRSGRHYKQFTALEVKQFGDVWLVAKAAMNNLTNRRVTVYDQVNVSLDVDVEDEFMTQRPLTDFAYRERTMDKYRNHLKVAGNE